MTAAKTHDYLVRLRDLIIQEREYAKALDLTGMAQIMREKEELMQILAHVQTIEQADKSIATQIRHENRRNAYLFKATLGWIRGTMEFFGKQTITSTYSASAGTISAPVNGRLLSGRI
ncbi:MAG: flagellar protein FlgN [Proteobacteria bacterium]|nr:flagellar protein FlgN [Pseudomonadota bacterium]MBU1649797.1 flagellar protein FlgN [Pseudomonadota bacterium]